MSDYSLTHNKMFLEYIPQTLRQGFLDRFIEMQQRGQATQFLCDTWAYQANLLFGLKAKFKKMLFVQPSQFHTEWFDWGDGRYLVTINTPDVSDYSEAPFVGIMFEEQNRNISARYYACLAHGQNNPIWMLVEYLSDGSRFNHGQLSDSSIVGFQNDIAVSWGYHISGGNHADEHQGKAIGPFVVHSNVDVTPANDESTIDFDCSWDSQSHVLSAEVLSKLRLLQSQGNIVLALHASVQGLLVETHSYVQFLWLEDGSLAAEVCGDYSDDGLALPRTVTTLFENCGLSLVPEGMGNYGLIIDGTTAEGQRQKILDGVFAAFYAGLRPSGSLRAIYF
jgi:hypothetical protein